MSTTPRWGGGGWGREENSGVGRWLGLGGEERWWVRLTWVGRGGGGEGRGEPG